MIQLLIVLAIFSVAAFSVWSMLVMNPVLFICTLTSVSLLAYLIDRDLKRG